MAHGIFHLLLLVALTKVTRSQCPVSGCSPNRCYCSEESVSIPQEPKLLWYKKLSMQLSTQGCVANGNNIVCPIERDTAIKEKKGCLVIDIKGSHIWECKSLTYIPLPLVDVSGKVIASDGHYLQAYDGDGKPLGKPIYLFPEEGGLFDLIITDNDFFLMIYKCGFIAAVDTNGIPWASTWLNGTHNSFNGTFVPLATPAVTGNRVYILTAFWPHNKSKFEKTNGIGSFYLRLYAMDVTTNMVGRLRVAWTMTKEITGYLPSLEGNFEDCKLTPPPTLVSGSSFKAPVGFVMTIQNAVIFSLNFNNVKGGYDRYLTIRLNDTMSSYKLIFYDDASYESHLFISSLSYMEAPINKQNNIKPTVKTRGSFDNYFIVGRLNTSLASNPSSHIDVLTTEAAVYFTSISLDTLLTPLVDVEFTSYLLSLELAPLSSNMPPFSYLYVIFGAKGTKSDDGTVEKFLVGAEIDISGQVRLMWKILMSDQCEAVGLLSTNTNEDGKLILIVSTECGVATYVL